MFTNKFVAWNRIGAYEKYATLKPGSVEACFQAQWYIQGYGDEVTKRLNRELDRYRWDEFAGCPCEYSMLVIRSVEDDDLFDIYFVDEDSLFLASKVGVRQGWVVLEALRMMKQWKQYDSQSIGQYYHNHDDRFGE